MNQDNNTNNRDNSPTPEMTTNEYNKYAISHGCSNMTNMIVTDTNNPNPQMTMGENNNFHIPIISMDDYNKKYRKNKLEQLTTNLGKDRLKLFWIIENKNEKELTEYCTEHKNEQEYQYFYNLCWNQVFTTEQAQTIKVYMCGLMDFSAIQHACDIGWIKGAKILAQTNLCNVQGMGLPVIHIDKLLEYCTKAMC